MSDSLFAFVETCSLQWIAAYIVTWT